MDIKALETIAWAPYETIQNPTREDWQKSYDALTQLAAKNPKEGSYPNTLGYLCYYGRHTGERNYDHPAKLVVTPDRMFEAAVKYLKTGKRICALNFASSVTPGGGVTTGAGSQEESLCRISTLYLALNDRGTAGFFYSRHRQMIRSGEMNRKNRDDCIYTPGVVVIREDTFDCEMLPKEKWYEVDVITCAAPDFRFDNTGRMYRPDEAELMAVLEKRWKRILSVAAFNRADILILGAFGCGVFGNSPEVVAQAFCNVFAEFERCFGVVEFAVFAQNEDDLNYVAFSGMKGIQKL